MRSSLSLLAAYAVAAASAQNLTDVLAGEDTLSLFARIVQKAGLVDTITSMDSATIFAPTDDALLAALQEFPNLVSSQSDEDDDDNDDNDSDINLDLDNVEFSDQFVNILTYHVVPGAAYAASDILPFPGVFVATALDDQVVNPYVNDNDGVSIFSRAKRLSTVETAGIEYDQGIIHTIDSILLPPQSPTDTALDLGQTYLYGALSTLDLAEDVDSANGITVFIPMNSAFIDVGTALDDLVTSDLTTLLKFHVVPGGVYYTNNITDGLDLDTLADTAYESNIQVRVDDDGAVYANNGRIITANILLDNGVAHLIDEVLNPANQEEDGYSYTLEDDGVGVPAFENAESATIPAFTSGIPTQSVGTFMPSSTYSAAAAEEANVDDTDESGASYAMPMMGVVAAAGVFGALLVQA